MQNNPVRKNGPVLVLSYICLLGSCNLQSKHGMIASENQETGAEERTENGMQHSTGSASSAIPNMFSASMQGRERKERICGFALPQLTSFLAVRENCLASKEKRRAEYNSSSSATSADGYFLSSMQKANEETFCGTSKYVEEVELEEVQTRYMQSPVAGHEIASIQKVANASMQRVYDRHVESLREKSADAIPVPEWREERAEVVLRQGVHERLMNYVSRDKLSMFGLGQGVKELKLWHGRINPPSAGMMQTEFMKLPTRVDRLYGQGLYFSPQASYVVEKYKPEELLLCKVCFRSAYPVTKLADITELRDKRSGEGYDACFIPVKKTSLSRDMHASILSGEHPQSVQVSPEEENYYPTGGLSAEADELLVFERAQVLPLYSITLQAGLPSSPALFSQFKTLSLLPITREKLRTPSQVLNIEESLAVLNNCLDIGEKRAESARDKDLVVFMGNTGSGKSTAINYLVGCEMEKISRDGIGLSGTREVVDVKSTSAKPALIKIKHEKVLEMFFPEVKEDAIFTYCSCPRFLETRGAEINIAHAVNIRRAIGLAKRVRVNMLLNYKALKADRAKEISEVRRILNDLFGGETRLRDHLDSVLIGITQVSPPSLEEDEMDVYQLRSYFQSDELLSANAERIITFDPLGEPIKGGLQRREWIDLLKSLPGIAHPSEILRTVLPLPDESKLIEIADELNERIWMGLLERHYEKVKKSLLSFGKLDRINHAYIKMLGIKATQNVLGLIQDKLHQITTMVMHEDWDSCKEMLSDLNVMRINLNSLPRYEWIENGYKEAKRLVGRAEQRHKESTEQSSKIANIEDEKDRLVLGLLQLDKKQEGMIQIREKIREDLEREKLSNKAMENLLEKDRQEWLSQLEDRLQYVTEEERKEIQERLEEQQRVYEKALERMTFDQEQKEEKKLTLLEELSTRLDKLSEQKQKLAERNEKFSEKREETQTTISELKQLLGSHYLGAEAWRQLGVEVGELPTMKAEMVSRVKEMQTKGEAPLLVLDIGMSIEELEKLCRQKGINVLAKEFEDDIIIRREPCYLERGSAKRWLLLCGSSDGILPGTRNKRYSDQVAYMEQHYAGFEVGGLRELMHVAILNYVQCGEVLFSEETLTYARVKEQYEIGDWKDSRITLGRNKKKSNGSILGLTLGNDGLDSFYCGLFGFLASVQ